MSLLSADQKPQLIYVGDPMCSWCYGISEELGKAKVDLADEVDFQILVGGLRPGGGEEWDGQFTSFLRGHWEHVAEASGQPFSYDLLSKEYFFYDTEPSCRAVVVAKSINQDKAYDFFKAVQRGFYYDNEDPKEVAFYKSICDELSMDYDTFSSRFQDEAYKVGTNDEFAEARKLGVNSFPTILLKQGNDVKVIARGFAKAGAIVQSVRENIK